MMANPPKKSALGRGLAALMGDDRPETVEAGGGRAASKLPIEQLIPNPYQPRQVFDPELLRELVESIKEKGLLQPLLVRPVDVDGDQKTYQIIAGERRWRAAQKAGLHEVPVVVRDMSDSEALELGIIENVQRHDLSAVEEAAGYKRLIEEFGHTQEQVARLVAKSRSHIANLLRLMTLPNSVIEMVADGRLSMGHARTIVGSKDAATLAKMIVAKGMSVRAAERLAKGVKGGGRKTIEPARKDTDTMALERELSTALGLKLQIAHHPNGHGEVRITYGTLEQLDHVCARLRKR